MADPREAAAAPGAGAAAADAAAQLAWGARADLEHGLWEANASAAGYVCPQAMVFQSVPAAAVGDAGAVDGYLRRLRGLSGYFDAVTGRYREAQRDGRLPTQAGVRQAAAQLAGHLGKDISADTLVTVTLPGGVDAAAVLARLRADRTLRFSDSAQIVRTVTDALQRAFHGLVLGSGAVPLGVLDQLVTRWAGEMPA